MLQLIYIETDFFFFFFNGLCKEMRVNEIGKDEMKKNESNN